MTYIRTISTELTSDDARYILHALNEFKLACRKKVEQDEDGDMTHMYANDIMISSGIYKKLFDIAEPAFGKDQLVVSYEEL